MLALLALVCSAQGEETSTLENLQAAFDLAEPAENKQIKTHDFGLSKTYPPPENLIFIAK